MTWTDLVLRLRGLLFRSAADSDLDDEMQFHLEMEARRHIAVGIGSNVALFTLFSAVALKPLPVPDPAGLVGLARATSQAPRGGLFSFADYLTTGIRPLHSTASQRRLRPTYDWPGSHRPRTMPAVWPNR